MDNGEKVYDVLILGSGLAGLTAAIYAGRAKLKVLVIERETIGGTVFNIKDLVNYPGILPAETGAELSERIAAQAWSFGAEKALGEAISAELEGEVKIITCTGAVYQGKTVIIATGNAKVKNEKRKIAGEDEYVGRGVSYCAICDGPFFTGLDTFVLGGGDRALEESLYLSKIARGVTIVHDDGTFRAEKKLIDLVDETENISYMMDTELTEIGGGDLLTRIVTKNVKNGEENSLTAAEGENYGVFVLTGSGQTSGFFEGALDTEDGYIVTDEAMHTNIPGVFAAGDVRKKAYRQAVLATADGATAALFAGRYLMEAGKNG